MKLRSYLGVMAVTMMLALGVGAVVAPAANAAGASSDANYTATNQKNSHDVKKGTIQKKENSKSSTAVPAKAASLSCYNASLSGRNFAVTCSGSYFYVYADCSNGYRYTYGPLAGTYRVVITCPAGTRATAGGAYGR
jgi:hypothetical protein